MVFDKNTSQVLTIDLNLLLEQNHKDLNLTDIGHVSISHGVWSRILKRESKLKSTLTVNSVFYDNKSTDGSSMYNAPIMLNNQSIDVSTADLSIPYYSFEKRDK